MIFRNTVDFLRREMWGGGYGTKEKQNQPDFFAVGLVLILRGQDLILRGLDFIAAPL